MKILSLLVAILLALAATSFGQDDGNAEIERAQRFRAPLTGVTLENSDAPESPYSPVVAEPGDARATSFASLLEGQNASQLEDLGSNYTTSYHIRVCYWTTLGWICF